MNSVVAEVYVPGLGFRSADGLRMPADTIVRHDERALAVMELLSTPLATEVAFEVKDDHLEAECMAGRFDLQVLNAHDVRLRDERGRSYARSTSAPTRLSFGQHDFGVFGRTLAFEPLPPDARRVVLDIRGALGDWEVPVVLVPISATDVLVRHELDASTTLGDVTMRLRGIALGTRETVVDVEAVPVTPGLTVVGIGDMQRTGDQLFALIDQDGRRFVEELSRETVRRGDRDIGRASAKFASLPSDALQLTLVIPSVNLADPSATLDVALPVDEMCEVRFGPYPMRLGPSSLSHDLLDAPGKPTKYGLRFALGPRTTDDARRALRPVTPRLRVDGVERFFGFGWHPDPDMTNISVELPEGLVPKRVTLTGAVVQVRGPWVIAFAPPA